ncbi:MAG TPA: phosphatidate cytidylyltransferase [Pelagibacteraceae bacterium]|jgi:phosphatidate cytidylyltransferase|nr:phosphatidate cytidylyltransferase [Pelagibacteraceae bacterium]|tara:strand:+ start:86 stop:766 length:681 start_codon:yes stop_codon:yes gene_type:complete
MSAELEKRIITSIILFLIAIFCILIHKFVFVLILIVTLFVCFNEWRNINYKYFKKKQHNNWKYFFVQFVGLVYLFIFLGTSIALRGNNSESIAFFIIILCICIFSDIGGYVFGKVIGGRKLIKISPNKTISGSLGSFIFSILPALLFNLQNYTGVFFEVLSINIALCLIVSLVCQLGDLLISYFKRLNKVKDTGTILPGHGGLLDRIDGLIFAIPTVYILKITQIF